MPSVRNGVHTRGLVEILAVAVLAAGGVASCASAQPLEVTFRGHINLPNSTTDQHGQPFTITGLSGISMVPGEGSTPVHRFLAVMDNSPKLVVIDAGFNPDGSFASVALVGGWTIGESLDFEGIVASDAARGTVFLCEEGVPSVREYRLSDGSIVRHFPTPPVFATRRANYGFESLGGWITDSTQATFAGTIWTCNEEALTADGNLSTAWAGTVVRLLRYTVADAVVTPGPQFAYVTDPIHGTPITGSRSGVSDLVVLPDGRLIALERSFALSGQGFFRTRLYEADTAGATDVSGYEGLIGRTYTAITVQNGRKRLLWSGDLMNLEGLTVGPRLADGSWALVGIVDDGDPISVNRLVAFQVRGVRTTPVRAWPRR
ncbi:MAG: esterase-like activity of phytase family protein [Phycisphaeraceae bacterium]|nr:esterase-like activity of phytase family protein [Phycisphaerae bacterium]MBX3392511.1 esterase-like activity of phytase family protein [Phycisphaeraceae bacterium]